MVLHESYSPTHVLLIGLSQPFLTLLAFVWNYSQGWFLHQKSFRKLTGVFCNCFFKGQIAREFLIRGTLPSCSRLEGVEKAEYNHEISSGGGEGGGAFPAPYSAVLPCGPDWFWVILNDSVKRKTSASLLGPIREVIAGLWLLGLIFRQLAGFPAAVQLAFLKKSWVGCSYFILYIVFSPLS